MKTMRLNTAMMIASTGLGLTAISTPARSTNAGPQLLIVTPRQWHAPVAAYAAARAAHLTAEVVDLEDALAAGKGADDPERLKRFLFDRWIVGNRALTYVLLVGDADAMPVRYMVLDRNTDAAFNYAFYPSDLYYADLAKPDGS